MYDPTNTIIGCAITIFFLSQVWTFGKFLHRRYIRKEQVAVPVLAAVLVLGCVGFYAVALIYSLSQ